MPNRLLGLTSPAWPDPCAAAHVINFAFVQNRHRILYANVVSIAGRLPVLQLLLYRQRRRRRERGMQC